MVRIVDVRLVVFEMSKLFSGECEPMLGAINCGVELGLDLAIHRHAKVGWGCWLVVLEATSPCARATTEATAVVVTKERQSSSASFQGW